MLKSPKIRQSLLSLRILSKQEYTNLVNFSREEFGCPYMIEHKILGWDKLSTSIHKDSNSSLDSHKSSLKINFNSFFIYKPTLPALERLGWQIKLYPGISTFVMKDWPTFKFLFQKDQLWKIEILDCQVLTKAYHDLQTSF